MAKRAFSKRELLDRWRRIQEELDDDDPAPSKVQQLRRAKEQWFTDSFQFLVDLPVDNHIWCGYSDIMGPLLETFHSYFNDKRIDSPLKLIWKRVAEELGQCAQCISQYHQAQETYIAEYESDTIDPLLKVLHRLDEERVTEHLKEINAKLRCEEYDPEHHSAEVVSIMFEVLTFPTLLDDQYLVNEFQFFIEEIERSHDVNLAGSQQYPGVYALLFLRGGRARAIGLRLAGGMVKLRRATDLDPLQPLLRKYIGFLETEVLPSSLDISRPRVQLERPTVWLGIKTLLGFLEAPAFEEGILEKYPNFLSIVLNHVSDDTLESSYAITCLRICFEMLGCKLWLRTTLSPSVMRNTLLGQCFHTRNEKSHKDIFDLFLPFLQSLEALQDGEHEKQRRHFLYFLLHQVTQSSNFSVLTRKSARKIALLIIHRGYKMNPPCPPFECAHMWGPSLVNSLKDSSLHCSLRQPAFDLVQTIIISDVSAMICLKLKYRSGSNIDLSTSCNDIDDEDELPFVHDVEESSSWSEFSMQSKLASCECLEWTCVPMLWFDALIEVGPSMLPVSFSKAVFWSLSHISMVSPNSSMELSLPVRDWLSLYAGEISSSFGWEAPNGSDDGGDGKETRNSVKASAMCITLLQTFKRFAAVFITQMEKHELHRQWTWEPQMAESLIIFLVDPNDDIRQAGKVILDHVSKARDLTSQLKFLCSSASSLSAIFSGFKHALKLVEGDLILAHFHNLHHLYFVLSKLVKDVVKSPQKSPANHMEGRKCAEFSSEGGFLRQPCMENLPGSLEHTATVVDMKSWEKFSYLLSSMMWPFILKCLAKGKELIESKICQMTYVRLLDALPSVFERLTLCASKQCENMAPPGVFDFKWLCDLVEWGNSSLIIIRRRWKQCMLSLMNLLKDSCGASTKCTVNVIEAMVSLDSVSIDSLREEVVRLTISLSTEAYCAVEDMVTKTKQLLSNPPFGKKKSFPDTRFSLCKEEHSKGTEPVQKIRDQEVVVLSDDETVHVASPEVVSSVNKPSNSVLDRVLPPASSKVFLSAGQIESVNKNLSRDILEPFPSRIFIEDTLASSQEEDSDALDNSRVRALTPVSSKGFLSGGQIESVNKNLSKDFLEPFPSRIFIEDTLSSSQEEDSDVLDNSRVPSEVKSSVGGSTKSHMNLKGRDAGKEKKKLNATTDIVTSVEDSSSICKKPSGRPVKFQSSAQALSSRTSKTDLELLKEDVALRKLVCDAIDDPLERALDSSSRLQSMLTKPVVPAPKRKVIQLQMPTSNKSGLLSRMESGFRRLKPPRLDDWYRPILELDYFAVVGLSGKDDKDTTSTKLKEVPLCFQSMEHYVGIFRPLVLEEFKAQLHNSYIETSSDDIFCGSLCVLSVERIDDFHLVRGRPDENESATSKGCYENDLVLFTRDPLQNSVQDAHVLGKVERREKSNKNRSVILVIRCYLPNSSSRLNKVRRLLIERSKWHLNRVMSIAPQVREFQALSSLHDIPVLPIILNPVDPSLRINEHRKAELGKLSKPLQNLLKSSFNDSQLRAIDVAIGTKASRRSFELCLIQGPPGTGKTRTIVATVSALLASARENCPSEELNNSSWQTGVACTKPRSQINQSVAIARAWQDAAFAKQMLKDTEKDSFRPTERSARGRVLVCAQSNAAVDELVSRISEGLYGSDGKLYKPYLVRVGNAKTVHPNSQPFFIDRLVEQRLAEDMINQKDVQNDANAESSSLLRARLEKLVDSIRHYESKRAKLSSDEMNMMTSSNDGTSKADDVQDMPDAAVAAKLNILYGQKKALSAELSSAQYREKKISEENWSLRNKIRKSILMEAEIVVTTLSGCGGDLYGVCSESASVNKFGRFSEQCLFDVVVIDEAAQALEPATLIPLQLLKSNGTRCIMVGDPKQLPATVLSNVASKFLYECSMFERLQRAGHPVLMLTEQYRMHPEICRFPSLHFYENKLVNGAQMGSKAASFHEHAYLGPYIFFDVIDGHEHHGKNSASLSLCNKSEGEAAIGIIKLLKNRYPSEFASRRIGIITPYRSQLSLLRSRFSSSLGPNIVSEMEFNTVDGFQGREVDILILSTVRASDSTNSSSIGFVADVRRMNVALTRAKFSLWIVGNAKTLQRNLHWAALVQNAKDRNLFFSVSRPYDSILGNTLSSSRGNLNSRLDSHPSHPKLHEMGRDATSGVEWIEKNAKVAYKGKVEPADQKLNAHPKRSQTSLNDNFSSSNIPARHPKGMEARMRAPVPKCKNDGNMSKKLKDKASAENVSEKNLKCSRDEDNGIITDVHLETDSTTKALLKKAKESHKSSECDTSDGLSKQNLSTMASHVEGRQKKSEAKGPKLPIIKESSKGSKEKKAERSFEHSAPSRLGRNLTLPSAEGSEKVNDQRPSHVGDAPKDLMAMRKRQRDDVDALLSSALIPSKKPEVSSKSDSVRKPPFSASARDISKSSKQSKR